MIYTPCDSTPVVFICVTPNFISHDLVLFSGVCTNGTAPSVSSINRILRNRAAERAAAEFARAAGYGLYPAGYSPWPLWGVPQPNGFSHPDQRHQGWYIQSFLLSAHLSTRFNDSKNPGLAQNPSDEYLKI